MLLRAAWSLLLLPAILSAQSTTNNSTQPKDPAAWFARASERMSLRMPGAAPFHLHAEFQANAGQEFLAQNQTPWVMTGTGSYDEVWLDPHKWRREVTFGSYHALEIEADGVRKMQASSDYVPSRVVMLLEALINPVPRFFTSKEFRGGAGWKVDQVNSGSLSLVRLSKSMGSQRTDYTDSFYFLPSSGSLAMSNFQGLTSIWSNDAVFDGKMVPKEFLVRAGDKDLLTSRLSIEAAAQLDPDRFSLDGPAAEPGMTLRPLHATEVRMSDLSGTFGYISNQLGPAPVFSMIGTLDRQGRFRELEILLAPNPKNAATIMNHFREEHAKPATIDGSPCQVRMFWRLM